MLSEIADPSDLPEKYGGQFPYDFGMPPDLDTKLKELVTWSSGSDGTFHQDMPLGPIKWTRREDGGRTAIAVGRVDGKPRDVAIMSLE